MIDTIHNMKKDPKDDCVCMLEFGRPLRNVTIAQALKAENQRDYHLIFDSSRQREEFCAVRMKYIKYNNILPKIYIIKVLINNICCGMFCIGSEGSY